MGYNPTSVLKRINEIVQSQNIKFEKLFRSTEGVGVSRYLHDQEKQPNDGQEFVSEYFHQQVRPRLMPFCWEKVGYAQFTDDAIFL